MKDIFGMTILAIAVVVATWIYVERQPIYSYEIVYFDEKERFLNLTIRTNVVNGDRCLVKDEGLLRFGGKSWEDDMSAMPGPKTVCDTNKHWRDFRKGDPRFK